MKKAAVITILVLSALFCLVSCKDEPDNKTSCVGTWFRREKLDDYNYKDYTIVFNEDGSVVFSTHQKNTKNTNGYLYEYKGSYAFNTDEVHADYVEYHGYDDDNVGTIVFSEGHLTETTGSVSETTVVDTPENYFFHIYPAGNLIMGGYSYTRQ